MLGTDGIVASWEKLEKVEKCWGKIGAVGKN